MLHCVYVCIDMHMSVCCIVCMCALICTWLYAALCVCVHRYAHVCMLHCVYVCIDMHMAVCCIVCMLRATATTSSNSFHMKDRQRIRDVWIAQCPEDLQTELSDFGLEPHCSFLMGWPLANYVATFRLVAAMSQSNAVVNL